MTQPALLRTEGDSRLQDEILSHEKVKEALALIDAASSEGRIPRVRRSLLARSLRLGEQVAPAIHAMIGRAKEKLGIAEPVECYVQPSADYNAGIFRPEDGRLLIVFTAALIEAFETEELEFVIGHELGHHLFGHHRVPIEVLFDPQFPIPSRLALVVSAWQRYAEISADRAGLVCATSFEGAARALFKLASGLRQAPNQAQVLAFLEQAKELGALEGSPRPGLHQDEWFSSHPFSPLRVEAAHLFSRSVHMTPKGTSAEALEVEVSNLMAFMEPGYLEADSESAEAMRRLVYAAGIVLASLDGEITADESKRLEGLLGPGALAREPNLDKLRELVPERVRDVLAKTRLGERAHLLRDLCTLARADGRVGGEEEVFLKGLAKQLQVDPMVVGAGLEEEIGLD